MEFNQESKEQQDLLNYHEGMTHVCVKCGAMVECANDKRKGACLTVRAMQNAKKRTCKLPSLHGC